MALTGFVHSNWNILNRQLFIHAACHLPALIVDCANCADPHLLYPAIDIAHMQNMYVFELELLHKFRDVLKHVPLYAKQLNVASIVVTTSDHLINYHDEEENNDIYCHAWQLMKTIGRTRDITTGVTPGSRQHAFARKYCDQLLEVEDGAYRQVTAWRC